MKKINNTISIISFIIIIFAIFLIINNSIAIKNRTVPKVFGYSYLLVLTGSMEPTINPDDLIVVRSSKEYFVGDIVSFYYDINGNGVNEVVTHRIIFADDEVFKLRGDAALENDIQEITKNDIIGKVIYQSSFLGGFLSMSFFNLQNILFMIIVLLFIFILFQIINIIKLTKRKNSDL